ncbi:hypothetical protein ACIOZM_08460 [Pseudomonas sp. NPDC087346]|uniref:hypothetical protein n=1 Tax=Pseudomonas sp. NPDC087346 TaxID=3364438 RepID=UPI003813E0BB
MSELKVIYLGPACQEQGQSSGREWCQDDVWDTCECGHESVRYVLGAELDRVTAERDGLQLSLSTADQTIDDLQTAIGRRNQRIEELERDKARLDALESNCWDVRFDSSPNGDAGDSSINIEIVGHWMDQPVERVIGENYSENLRAAIDQAMTAPAYPPARPEYPEIDEALEAAVIQ